MASNVAGTSTVSVEVVSLDTKKVGWCKEKLTDGITWSLTAPNTDDIQPCPPSYTGVAKRKCDVQAQDMQPTWTSNPDFQGCVLNEIQELKEKVSIDIVKLRAINGRDESKCYHKNIT